MYSINFLFFYISTIFPSLLYSRSPYPRFIKVQVSYGLEQRMAYQVAAGLISSTCIKSGQSNPAWRPGSQKPTKLQAQMLISLIAALQTDQAAQLSHNCLLLLIHLIKKVESISHFCKNIYYYIYLLDYYYQIYLLHVLLHLFITFLLFIYYYVYYVYKIRILTYNSKHIYSKLTLINPKVNCSTPVEWILSPFWNQEWVMMHLAMTKRRLSLPLSLMLSGSALMSSSRLTFCCIQNRGELELLIEWHTVHLYFTHYGYI